MSERAQRLGDFLEKSCGWAVWGPSSTASTTCICGKPLEDDWKFCPICGSKNIEYEKTTLGELEAAIKFALKEDI